MKSETIGKLAEALAKAQGEMDAAKKDSTNPFFKSKYADLSSVIEAIKEPLSKNGLSYTQPPESDETGHYVTTTLLHSSGEWISSRLKLILTKTDMQSLGSAITYARRYMLSSMIGITQDDDDGNSASGKQIAPQAQVKGPRIEPNIYVVSPEQVKAVQALVDRAQWSPKDVIHFNEMNFGKSRLSQLDTDEYDKLCHALETAIQN